jgi:MoaA/NifB/PqqE/SkfB family radical SAM enzyme
MMTDGNLRGNLAKSSTVGRIRRTVSAFLKRANRGERPEQTGSTESRVLASQDSAAQSKFCILAWNHLQIAPNGTVKMCCVANEDLHEGKRPLSVYTDSYEAIWNSKYMRDARRGLAEGEQISPCARCFHEEATVGMSRRTVQNAYWLKAVYGRTEQEFIADAKVNDWAIADRPQFLQLNMGNLCNLACRMCSSQYSSRIESDPVHSKWMPAAHTDVVRWRGSKLHVGPRPSVGVTFDGFHDYEAYPDQPLRWTDGHGRMTFPLPAGTSLISLGLVLKLAPGIDRFVRIVVNGLEVFGERISGETANLVVPLIGTGNQATAEIEVISGSKTLGGRRLGVALCDAWVERDAASSGRGNTRTMMRFDANAGWWGQPEFMFDEMLGQPDKLQRIIFQGGEPLIIKEVEDVLDHLIKVNATQNVILEIVSNMTIVKDTFLEKLRPFKSIELGCSIDGIGADFEYIRYPASWSIVEANIERMRMLPNVRVQFNVAVQAYNLMRVTDLLRYCDARGFLVHTHFLVGPYYLSVLVLPPAARQIAAQRLEDYLAGDCLPHNRDSAVQMLHYLKQHAEVHKRELYRQFMLFTNDMDVSRSQSFADSHPDLVELLRADGLSWTLATAHAAPQ